MPDTAYRRYVLAILAVALVLRVGYLAFGEVLPVMWDARRYAAAGLALISLVDHSAPAGAATEHDDRYRFRHYYEKYIQGEQIEWLSYAPHTLTQAKEELFFSGPLYPLVLAAVFFAAPAADFTVARTVGVLCDLLANVLLIAICVRLVGRRAALIAGAIYAVYFPFILASTMLLLETSTSLLILLTIYLMIRSVETNRRRPLVLAGLLAGALVLNKPTAMLLAIPFLLGYYFYTRPVWGRAAFTVRALSFAVPLAAVFVGWTAAASLHYGRVTLRDPEYADANLRQSTSIPNAGYDLDMVEEGFWERSVAGDILADPAGFAGLTVQKFDRLWRRPYNDFRKSFLLPGAATELLHLAVVLGGLAGLLLLVRVHPGRAAWPVFIMLYYTAIHLVFHALSRYNFQAMGMVMAAFGYLASETAAAYAGRTPAAWARPAAAVGVVILGLAFDAHWINAVFGTGLSEGLVVAALAAKSLLVLAGICLLLRPVVRRLQAGAWTVPAVTAAVVAMVMASHALAWNQWAEFGCRLETTDRKAGTRIYISTLRPVADNEMLAVAADLNSGAGRRNTFSLQIGEATIPLVGGQPPLAEFFYPKPTYRYYAQLIPMGLEEFRQYAVIPVPDSMVRRLIGEQGYLEVSVAINGSLAEENNFVTLWGRYDGDESTGLIPGWRRTSIERFVHQNDPRLPQPVKFVSDSAVCYYIPRADGDPSAGGDLAPAWGRQTGRYNLFLMHFKADGSVDVY